jgi:uncharacterized protein YjiS (DUF1127 family)
MAQHVLRTITIPSPDRHIAIAREMLGYWMERSRTRRQLRALETHSLEDVGLTRAQAITESDKYFWQQ